VLADHEFINSGGRLLSVVLLCGFDRVTKHPQFVVSLVVRLQAVVEHLLTDRRELLLIRNDKVKKYTAGKLTSDVSPWPWVLVNIAGAHES